MKHLTPSQQRLGFRIHAISAVGGLTLLLVLNLILGAPYWVGWVVLGWGIGLASHWWFVLGPGADWHDRHRSGGLP
jgi:hypothetical protein